MRADAACGVGGQKALEGVGAVRAMAQCEETGVGLSCLTVLMVRVGDSWQARSPPRLWFLYLKGGLYRPRWGLGWFRLVQVGAGSAHLLDRAFRNLVSASPHGTGKETVPARAESCP